MRNIISLETAQKVLFFFMAFVFFVAVLPTTSFRGDMNFWLEWTNWIHNDGLGNIYHTNAQYHPFFLYCLWIFQEVMGSMDEVRAHLNYVKVFPLIFDFLGALTVFFILKKDTKNAIIYPFFLLFNISYMYNTMIWGQVDSIHTSFVALSFIFILRERPLFSIFFFLLALNTKLQAIIYLPIIGLLILPHFTRSASILLKTVGIIVFAQFIIFLPFIFNESLGRIWKVVVEAEGRHPHVSMNAFNLWYFFFDVETNLAKVQDANIFALGMSYKTWGRMLFFLFSTIALLPLLKNCYEWIRQKLVPTNQALELSFLTGGLITLIFFYFNTQMHERYAHSAILLFFLYGVKSKRYWLYILCSFACLFNMEKVLKAWDFSNYKALIFTEDFITGYLIFTEDFIASLFLVVIIGSIYRLYKSYFNLKMEPAT